MLKDSRHIGHSNPSSWLEFEQTSSSEESKQTRLGSEELLLSPMLVMALEAKPHITPDKQGRYKRRG
ncbi:unnamed protein product [Prunus armeniaca]